jgi:hypothetical protein
MLIEDLNIRIVDAATGELLRELTLNPTIDYQPQNPRNPRPHSLSRRFRGFRCRERSQSGAYGTAFTPLSLAENTPLRLAHARST